MTKYKLEDAAIFKLETGRAIQVLNILRLLQEIWKLDRKNARKNWISDDEWIKTQHFFLSNSSINLSRIQEMLESKEKAGFTIQNL